MYRKKGTEITLFNKPLTDILAMRYKSICVQSVCVSGGCLHLLGLKGLFLPYRALCAVVQPVTFALRYARPTHSVLRMTNVFVYAISVCRAPQPVQDLDDALMGHVTAAPRFVSDELEDNFYREAR